MIILSILIPSIPERREQLTTLLAELYTQQAALNRIHPTLGSVEILVDDSIRFLDGGLSIGNKRELLKQRAGGKYLCFLDDDDGIMPNYLEELVRRCNDDQDIVTFRAIVKNDHYCALIDMNLETATNTEVSPHGTTNRTPWHICPVLSSIAKNEAFSDLNHNEDWTWMERVLVNVKTQSHSDMILTQYNHSEAGSEADAITRIESEGELYRTVLISLSIDGREKYTEKSKCLEKSLAENWRNRDVRLYKTYPEYCTPHNIIPYKFKFDLINQARKDGYNRIIWLDSSIRLLNCGLLDLFGQDGLIAFDNLGHPLWKYISDKARNNLGMSEAQLKQIPQTWGGAIGFDFTRDKACEIFEEIYRQSTMGSFDTAGSSRPGFVSHRHDQAVMSCIFWKHKYKLLPYGTIAAKADVTEQTYLQYGD